MPSTRCRYRPETMKREFSAGGVLVRMLDGRWMVAAIQPAGKPAGVWALPKGRIGPGESAEATALREVAEETGARGRPLARLGSTQYWFNWEGERVFKVVAFFLIGYESGELGDLTEEFRHEVADVQWLPLAEAPRLLAYPGEREIVEKAVVVLGEQDI
jgi:8-oxo-dGTP pyrophosphatase MutT (NUDIX family)